ncbi:hypothetical protein F5148DRAFT_1146163 [Russula earlei]|uniref:Uncharacterized protein n=1 Tax=Russula earlei TaxID=71964 RepID=A0ACC0UKT6_9AGAM|nr:hypothetical protein F5148DRAFT_1146163 [Russula earlei]
MTEHAHNNTPLVFVAPLGSTPCPRGLGRLSTRLRAYPSLLNWIVQHLLFDNLEQLIWMHTTKQNFTSGWYLAVHINSTCTTHPATQSHGLPDDLESFYWVLLYMVMKYQHPKFKDISQDMQDVFDGYRYTGHNHVAQGDKGKLLFLDTRVLSPTFIKQKIRSLPCREIIEGLRTIFQDLYHGSNVHLELCKLQEEEPDEKTLEACKKLSSSEWVLTLIEGRLKSNKWPNADGSLYKSFLGHDPMRSSCKHKAQDSTAAKEHEMSNKMHRGLFPPSGPSSSRCSFLAHSQDCPDLDSYEQVACPIPFELFAMRASDIHSQLPSTQTWFLVGKYKQDSIISMKNDG